MSIRHTADHDLVPGRDWGELPLRVAHLPTCHGEAPDVLEESDVVADMNGENSLQNAGDSDVNEGRDFTVCFHPDYQSINPTGDDNAPRLQRGHAVGNVGTLAGRNRPQHTGRALGVFSRTALGA